MSFKLSSPAFTDGGTIPNRYSRDGGNFSPPLEWTNTPKGTKSLALIVDDPDAPSGVFVHWLLYGIPSTTNKLEEGQPITSSLPGTRQGRNGFGANHYDGPQPPEGIHRYFFRLFALDK